LPTWWEGRGSSSREFPGGDTAIQGEGDTPIKEVLHLLKSKKYDIPADIEFKGRG